MAADERDWVGVVLHGTCAECGLEAGRMEGPAVAPHLAAHAHDFAALLAGDPAVLRGRPSPDVWSALEYACHVRDVLGLFAARVDRVLAEDEPQLGWWDHEAAAVDERYNDQDPAMVAAALRGNASLLADALARVGDRWDRAGIRRPWERFTVADLARFALHEGWHHLGDARRSCAG